MSEDIIDYTRKLVISKSLDQLVDCSKASLKRGIMRYKTERGTTYGIGVYKDEDVAIQISFLSSGTIFGEHWHKEPVRYEMLIVKNGSIEVHIGEQVHLLKKYDSIKIGEKVLHKVIAMEDTEVIAITVPADKSFPDAR